MGDCFLVLSVFNIPEDIDKWIGKTVEDKSSGEFFTIKAENIEKVKNSVSAREAFASSAINAGYDPKTILKVNLKDWMIKKLVERRYQEKQVDTTVVAMLVKYAITLGDDFHAVITGDADIIPAITVAYPEFTKNVLVVTTHPDELEGRHKQTSFSYAQNQFGIEPLFLQYHVDKIMMGNYIHMCRKCKKYFKTNNPLPKAQLPYCFKCKPRKKTIF
jgi:hypothetical protein